MGGDPADAVAKTVLHKGDLFLHGASRTAGAGNNIGFMYYDVGG